MNIVLPVSTVSAFHGWFNQTAFGEWKYSDNESTNGSFVNGVRVIKEATIKSGDDLALGTCKGIFDPMAKSRKWLATSILEGLYR